MFKLKKGFSLVEISVVVLVVGILIASITSAMDMVAEAKLRGIRSQTKASKVNRMAGLVLWLEPSLADSIFEAERIDGKTISQWSDINPQSDSKIIFKDGDSTSTINYKEKGENSIPVVKFTTGANDFLYPNGTTPRTYNLPVIFPQNKLTIFAVVKPQASLNIFSFCEYATSTFTCAAGKEITLKFDASIKAEFKTFASSSTSATITATNASTRPVVIISALKDDAGNKLFVDGASVANATANTYNTSNLISGTFKIGGGANNAEIYEIIVFSNALIDSDRQAIEGYLSKKYNIKVVNAAS